MSMVFTMMPGMTSKAAGAEGETEAAVSDIQDENSQRLEEVTAMDEDGAIREIADVDGTVDEADGADGIALFAMRSSSPQVVNFNTKGNAVTNYTDEDTGSSGYTNGAYGADAAYLGMTSDGKIRFMLSGVTGTVSASDVQLVDYSSVADHVSYYTVSSGKLIHYISQDLEKAPTSAVNNGTAPSYLSEGVKYYSYDGHYFYTDYSVMLTDYQSGADGTSAVNAGSPFSNYFQFLDMNLSTGYSGDELDSILNAAMANAGVDQAASKLTGTGNSFVKYQNTYSVNALLSLGIAINESAWGTSSICLTKNNIFGLNAVDSSPDDAYAFPSIDDCIREFMDYQMANAYLKDGQWSNHGEYLGNKGGGINVSYASDPYWGEKAAAHAWNLDTLGGGRDYLGGTGGAEDPVTPPPTTEGSTTPPPTTEGSTTPPPTTEGTTTPPPATEEPTAPPTTTEESTTPPTTTEKPTASPATEEPTAPPTTTEEPTTPPTTTTGESTTLPPTTEEPTTTPPTDGTVTGSPSDETVTVTEPPANETVTAAPQTGSEPSDETAETTAEPKAEPAGVQTQPANSAVTITPKAETQPTDTAVRSPKTGDAADAALWIALAGVSGVLLITALSVNTAKKRIK